ncbi:hypothetical protein KX02_360 [Francisella tularensis subsp. novicida]|nr:hypothetical protein KX02_360 [Francisella tularensis subsp. novicida]
MAIKIFTIKARHVRHDRPKNQLKALIYIALNRGILSPRLRNVYATINNRDTIVTVS